MSIKGRKYASRRSLFVSRLRLLGLTHVGYVGKVGLASFAALILFLVFILLEISDDTSTGESVGIGRASEGMMTGLRARASRIVNTHDVQHLPARVRELIQKNEVVGDRLIEVMDGRETVEEILHGAKHHADKTDQPPMTVEEVITFLSDFIHRLHEMQVANKHADHFSVWQLYHDLALKTLYPWDRMYLQRMPERREDDSIFLSLASYRDENCVNTLKGAYGKAKNPDKLFVGLVQQNCEENCRSGVLEGAKIVDVEPDEDCHKVFCESSEGKPHCDAGRIRALHIAETESLGPYAARYFASKLWGGEQWYMQIDSHMTFAQDWDSQSVEMLQKAPSKKPVISHYPPSENTNFEKAATIAAPRICGPVFADSPIEAQIIRLDGANAMDKKRLDIPRFAPLVAAGYFVAHSDFLREVPFDPFLPWIFMGEEIIMSARLWTSGYDIFSPTHSVVGHIYFRRHKPKFWETVHRVFHMGIHNPLQMLILDRVKYQLKYPEAARDMLKQKTVLTAVEQYTMGTERSLDDYFEMIGVDMVGKIVKPMVWCFDGQPPKWAKEEYGHLYQ